MKKRPYGFLLKKNIDHDSEAFDYIRELHGYLWEIVHCVIPSARGKLSDYLDIVVKELKYRAN